MKKLALLLLLATGSLCFAQNATPVTNCTTRTSLICTIPNLYGPNGLILKHVIIGGADHLPHFNGAFQGFSTPLGEAIGSELTMLPLASPASGFTTTFDETTGLPTRTQQSFGPIFAERAETTGKGKFFFALTYQYFTFDSLDGMNLGNVPAVFTHDGGSPTAATFKSDFITTNNSIQLYVNQATAFATYGVARRVDVSVAIPMLQVRLTGNSFAAIHWTNPATAQDPSSEAHIFQVNGIDSQTKGFRNAGSASGIGDVTFRVKGAVYQGEHGSVAFAADLRLPTGDAENFLGSGAYGIKPFLIASLRKGRWSPHVNAGYQFNGNSLLAGNFPGYQGLNAQESEIPPVAPTKAHLPNDVFYTAGADVGATRNLTLCFDFLGQSVLSGTMITPGIPYATSTIKPEIPSSVLPASPYATTSVRTGNFNVLMGSAGLKTKVGANLLLTANVLFQMNNQGLRAKAVPMFGLSYTF